MEDAEAVNRALYADLVRRADALASFYNESKSKYTYFLMAAAGASMGYALQKLDGLPRSALNSLAVVATILWAISILLGCLAISKSLRILVANHGQMRLSIASMTSPLGEGLRQIKTPELTDKIKLLGRDAVWLARIQFWTLIVGVWVYAAWRIVTWIQQPAPSPADAILGAWSC